MSKAHIYCRTVGALFAACVSVSVCRGQDKPEAGTLAHYRFNGNAKDANIGNPDFELKNTEFRDNALYLNGKYERALHKDGYRAVCKTPKLDCQKFSVALRFEAEDFTESQCLLFTSGNSNPAICDCRSCVASRQLKCLSKRNLLTGGTSGRWFGLERSSDGNLVVNLNGGSFRTEVEGAWLGIGKWTVVACSVDVPGRKVILAVNGKKVAVIDLPKDFKLEVCEWEEKEKDTDKNWSFTNYGNGNVFHGWVDELLIYGRAMSAEELELIPLRP